MNSLTPLLGRMWSQPLLISLPIQAALFFYNLDLLPVWGDEQFTLTILSLPWPQAFEALKADIHPPLYYFIAGLWIKLPWPGTPVTQLRAFSGLVGLLATVLVYFLWIKDRSPSTKWWFLSLWTFSPVLVLYCRMARSYSMQLALGSLLLYLAHRLIQYPGSKKVTDAYAVVAALLLYTHYLPGLAIVGATAAFLLILWLRDHKRETLNALLFPHFLVFLLYFPWLPALGQVFGRVAAKERYLLLDNWAAEYVVGLAYWFGSFTFGETPPLWGIGSGVLLAIPVGWLVWRGASQVEWLWLFLLVAVIGYIGASSWVTLPFIPARLLFLLPLYLILLVGRQSIRPRFAGVIFGGVLLVCLGSLWSYVHAANFFNKGYLIPYAEIAEQIKESSRPESTLVVVDQYNGDVSPLLADLGKELPYVVVDHPSKPEKAKRQVNQSQPEVIWYLRNTHDISPGNLNEKLELELQRQYRAKRHEFLPYTSFERRLLGWLGLKEVGTHYYQMLELRRR